MHEDIDDYEPDMNAYYNMHPEERKLRNQLYYWHKRYSDGKINYAQYIRGLDDFYEILDDSDRKEIKAFKKEQEELKERERKLQENKRIIKAKEREEFNRQIAWFFIILMLIIGIVSVIYDRF